MADEAIALFASVTGQSDDVARIYLGMTDHEPSQAITLFFESPDLASGIAQPGGTTNSNAANVGREDSDGVVHLDSDEEMDEDTDTAMALGRAADLDDDEAMARRLQEEMYAGGDTGGDRDADGVRAPIARTRETLVGGANESYPEDNDFPAFLPQMRSSRQTAPLGIFNQRSPTIWDESADADTRARRLAHTTGGASTQSTKAQQLGEAFRPPFELMCRLPWDVAREQGKDDAKWIMVNVQNNSIFDCQNLNRDIWKDPGIKEVVKENFIFIQYAKDDPAGSQYINYYFPLVDSDAAFPHIAIVDPRTGEQVKVWSGPPNPKPADFLMQLFEFLDRYSLDVTKRNPVARRKPDKAKSKDVERLTEQEMLDLALKNSLGDGEQSGSPKEHDPDELTKSIGGVAPTETNGSADRVEQSVSGVDDGQDIDPRFQRISSTNPHVEPAPDATVTRIQFRHAKGRVVRKFQLTDPVRRIYEWLKAEPLEGYPANSLFELKSMGKDLIEFVDATIAEADLKNGTVMVEYIAED